MLKRTWRATREKIKGRDYWRIQAGFSAQNRVSISLGYVEKEEADRALARMQEEEDSTFGTRRYDRLLRMWNGPDPVPVIGNDDLPNGPSQIDLGKPTFTAKEAVRHFLLTGGWDLIEPTVKEVVWAYESLADYCNDVYGPARSEEKPKTWRTEQEEWRVILRSSLGKTRLDQIDAHNVDDYLAALKKRNGDPATWNMKRKHRNAITALLTFAYRKKHRPQPVPTWFKLKGSTERSLPTPEPLTPDEIERLIDGAEGHGPNERIKIRAMIAVCFAQGLRPGEATAMCWEDIDWQGTHVSGKGTMRVRGTKTSGSAAPIPLFPVAIRELQKHWSHLGCPTSGLIFPAAGGKPYTMPQHIRKIFKTAATNAGFGDRRVFPYLGRHSAGTNLVVAGVPIQTVAKILRHTNPRMLEKHYDHSGALRAPGLGDLFKLPDVPQEASAPQPKQMPSPAPAAAPSPYKPSKTPKTYMPDDDPWAAMINAQTGTDDPEDDEAEDNPWLSLG